MVGRPTNHEERKAGHDAVARAALSIADPHPRHLSPSLPSDRIAGGGRANGRFWERLALFTLMPPFCITGHFAGIILFLRWESGPFRPLIGR